MLETAFFNLAAQVVSDICLSTSTEEGTKLLAWVRQSANKQYQERIYQWSQRYVENYVDRHGTLKVLGLSEPINLDSIYTKVRLLSNRDIYKFASVDGLEEAFRETNSFQKSKRRKKPIGLDVANQERRLMVLGAPGAGKSTLLRKIGLEALKGQGGKYKHKRIPIFLELKRFDQANIDIVAMVAKEFEICEHPRPLEYAKAALKAGKLVILFDGLDEVPTEFQNNVINAIEDFVDQYDQNRFVASCRVAAYNKKFRQFRDVAIADFDDSQIEQFIQNWFRSEQDHQMETGKKCWQLLSSDKHRGARELAQTPLLLTFLCLVYDKSQTFPENRSQLYNKALRILLEEWAASKRLPQEKIIYAGLHIELEEELLADIAYWGFKQDKLFFEKWELVEQIRRFLTGNLNADKTLNGEAVLNAIAVQQGIFVERAEDIYSFSHLTLQEYLTAKYIVDNHLVEQYVDTHITDKRWSEVFILVAGLAKGRSGADSLLLTIEKRALEYAKTTPTGRKFLMPWMQWAVKVTTGSKSSLSLTAKRSVAITEAYAHAHAYAKVYAGDNINTHTKTKAYAKISAEEAYAHTKTEAYAYVEAYAYAEAYAYSQILAKTYAEAKARTDTEATALAKAHAYAKGKAKVHAHSLAIVRAKAEARAKVAAAEAKARAAEAKSNVYDKARAIDRARVIEAKAARARAKAIEAKVEAMAKSRIYAEAKARAKLNAEASVKGARIKAEARAKAAAIRAEARARAAAVTASAASASATTAAAAVTAKSNAAAAVTAKSNAEAKTAANIEAKAAANANANAKALTFALAKANANIIKYFVKYCEEMRGLPELFIQLDFQELALKFKFLIRCIPSKDSSPKEHQEFARMLIRTWLEAFCFPEELLQASRDEVSEIDREYFYPYKLMLDCKEAAVRISPVIWQAIEERMFLPPEE